MIKISSKLSEIVLKVAILFSQKKKLPIYQFAPKLNTPLEQKPLKSPETNVFAAGFSKLLESSQKIKSVARVFIFLYDSRNFSKPLAKTLGLCLLPCRSW